MVNFDNYTLTPTHLSPPSLRLHDAKKGWSGPIPFQSLPRNVPWLVKVPNADRQQFTTFCVRVVRETIADDGSDRFAGMPAPPQRLLVVVWPMFVVRSMLPVDVTLHVTGATNPLHQLAGRGRPPVELSIPGTYETEHEITFDTK